VSADAFTDNATRASYSRAEITLNDAEIARLPTGATLIPGMPVEAFIRTADRTPLNYLTRPLMDYIARTFRDG
jgi:HlyD family secretion protein